MEYFKLNVFRISIDDFYKNDCNSLMSVRILKEFIWYKGKPLNYSLEKTPNSQDLPEYLVPTFGLVIVERDTMLDSRSYIGSKPYFLSITITVHCDCYHESVASIEDGLEM